MNSLNPGIRTKVGEVIHYLYPKCGYYQDGDERQYGAPLGCGPSVSEFEPHSSHEVI